MPRQPNGNYELPLPDVISGDTVEATWANTSLHDIAAALTDSLSRTGQGQSSQPILVVDGSAGAPGLAFVNEANTGLHRPSAGDLYASVLGVNYMRLGSNGVQFSLNGTDWFTPAPADPTEYATYTEGDWTPQLEGFNMAAGNGGQWTRIGNQVTLFGDVKWGARTGSGTDPVLVSGLPWEIRDPTTGNARMYQAAFMAWSNVNLSGRSVNGDPEVFTRAMVKDPGGAPKTLRLQIYVGANDVTVSTVWDADLNEYLQIAEPLDDATPSASANDVVTPIIVDVLNNGEFSFSLTYMTDDPLT